jgi:hypothetical protein
MLRYAAEIKNVTIVKAMNRLIDMGIKYYCDKCGKEITKQRPNVIADRIVFKLGKYVFQIIMATEGCWNKGFLCLPCFKELVKTITLRNIGDE